jgi:polyphosphate kinase
MNSLVDPDAIEALYRASQAGVKIDLIIRGICCLRPGVPGVSENINVRSIVGRFLEHSRIFYFEGAGEPQLFVGSADWMPRNFHRRIEVVFPIEDPALRDRIVGEILALQLADNVQCSELDAEGRYASPAVKKDAKRVNSQERFMALALGESKSERRTAPVRQKFPRVKLAPRPTP